MRILFNRLSAIGPRTGVGHYAHQLLGHLRSLPGVAVVPYPSKRLSKWDQRLRCWHGKLQAIRQGFKPVGPFRALAPFAWLRWPKRRLRQAYLDWLEWTRREAFFGDYFDLYHEPNFIPLASSVKTVTTLHDLSALLHPEWHPSSRLRWYEERFSQSLEQSNHFIAVSEFTRRQVMRYLGVPPERVTCVHNAARPQFRPLSPQTVAEMLGRRGLPSRYLLCVGTIEPRKNILRLMRAYCSLPTQVRDKYPLLLVGQWGWLMERELKFYEEEACHRGVCHIGYLADEDMPAVYNGARALVYPSLYEGFGLPPVEMLACGGAVLTSTAEALVETVGGQAHLVAPEDTDGWRDALLRVATDNDWWSELRAGSTRAASQISWERCARETVQVYRSILSGAADQPSHRRGAAKPAGSIEYRQACSFSGMPILTRPTKVGSTGF